MSGRKWLFLGGLFLATLLLTLGVSKTMAEGKKCNMKQIEVAYKCPYCDKIYDKAGKCKECSTEDEEVTLKKIEVCVKTGYVCEGCGKESLKPGRCEDCDRELTAKTVKSEIVYRCPECGWDYDAPGNCKYCTTDEDKPVKFEKTCKQSGIFPHVSE